MSGLPRFASCHRPFLGLALASVLGLAAAGCGVTGPSDPLERERERLEQARAQWRSQGILDYRYTFQLSCFCVEDAREPVVITVARGTIVSVQRVADGSRRTRRATTRSRGSST